LVFRTVSKIAIFAILCTEPLVVFQNKIIFNIMSVAFWSKKLVVGESAEVQPPEGYILNLQQASLVSNVKNSVLQLGVKTIAIEGEEVKKHDAV
jgi:hypothetical protein